MGSRVSHSDLLVELSLGVGLPGLKLLRLEPESELTGSRGGGVGTMDDVTSNVDTEVTTNGAGGRGQRVGDTNHETGGLDDTLTLEGLVYHDSMH
jgi:hypothetical protein